MLLDCLPLHENVEERLNWHRSDSGMLCFLAKPLVDFCGTLAAESQCMSTVLHTSHGRIPGPSTGGGVGSPKQGVS